MVNILTVYHNFQRWYQAIGVACGYMWKCAAGMEANGITQVIVSANQK